MKVSGYGEKELVEVLLAGLRGYRRMVRDEAEGRRPINRPEWIGRRKRRLQKILGKCTWFKKKRKPRNVESLRNKNIKKVKDGVLEREIETVMFVPYTDGSKLQRQLQTADDEFIAKGTQKRIKFVERGGQTLERTRDGLESGEI